MTTPAPDFAQLATRELLTSGDLEGPAGVAARHRARTWAILALAQATETQALEPITEPTRKVAAHLTASQPEPDQADTPHHANPTEGDFPCCAPIDRHTPEG